MEFQQNSDLLQILNFLLTRPAHVSKLYLKNCFKNYLLITMHQTFPSPTHRGVSFNSLSANLMIFLQLQEHGMKFLHRSQPQELYTSLKKNANIFFQFSQIIFHIVLGSSFLSASSCKLDFHLKLFSLRLPNLALLQSFFHGSESRRNLVFVHHQNLRECQLKTNMSHAFTAIFCDRLQATASWSSSLETAVK